MYPCFLSFLPAGHAIVDTVQKTFDPPFDKALLTASREEGLHLIAVQMPRNGVGNWNNPGGQGGSKAAAGAAQGGSGNSTANGSGQTGSAKNVKAAASGAAASKAAAPQKSSQGQIEIGMGQQNKMLLPPPLMAVLRSAGVPLLIYPDRWGRGRRVRACLYCYVGMVGLGGGLRPI